MIARLLLILLLALAVGEKATAADFTANADPASYAEKFNPDIFALDKDGEPLYPMKNAFGRPYSDIADKVAVNNWFNLLVYLPFLVLPQVLLVLIIFRFKDRGDGRKPATFMTNHKLEALWTVIPILALIVVSVPVAKVLYRMELAPEEINSNDPNQATDITITGHQFYWEYSYKMENISLGLGLRQAQDPMVVVKDRAVLLNITSGDVNHAWWVPAFAVKKTAIRGRFTNCWFTPTETGVFKGDCAELCGEGHGRMFISALVVTPGDFEIWKRVQHDHADTAGVWDVLQPSDESSCGSDDQLKAAVAKYLGKDDCSQRRFSLRYWVAADYIALHRCWTYSTMADELAKHEAERKAKIDRLLADMPMPSASSTPQ